MNAISPGFKQSFQAVGQSIHNSGVFVGCPLEFFEKISRDQLIVLLDAGLSHQSKVLDIGCGCLRAGSWLIHFLDERGYFGLEPNVKAVRAGLDGFEGLFSILKKSPSFSYVDNFDLNEFNDVVFDYFTGLSIWSHAPKCTILKMLDQFVTMTHDDGKFVTSYFPTDSPQLDYTGDQWIGRSHQCDSPGMIPHLESWVNRECAKRDLLYKPMTRLILGQQWVCISKN